MAAVTESKVDQKIVDQASAAKPFAVELAKADAAYELVVPKIAADIAKLLGTKPTFPLWNEVALAFRGAYVETRKCEMKTADNRWYVITDYMEKNYELKKPSAPTVAAQNKSKERAAFDKKVKAAKAQYVKPAEAFQKAEELTKQGKVADAKVVMAAAQELQKAVLEDVKKQNKERVGKAREQVKAALAKCEDVETLMAALEVLKYGKDVVKAAGPRKASKVDNKQPAKV
jgi:hypothetical protein